MVKVISVTTTGGRVIIELDDGRRYKIRHSDLAVFPVFENMEMEDTAFEQKILLCQYPEALNAAVAMLARRACSRREIRNKLLSRGWCRETVDMVFAKLDQQNLLDDRDFSRQWTHYRASSNYGPDRIYRELRSKGIDEETALESISSICPEDQLSRNWQSLILESLRGIRSGKSRRADRSYSSTVVGLSVFRLISIYLS